MSEGEKIEATTVADLIYSALSQVIKEKEKEKEENSSVSCDMLPMTIANYLKDKKRCKDCI